MSRHVLSLLAACALPFTGCTTVHDDLSRQLLVPPGQWLVSPADLGLPAEPVELALSEDASLTGFWIPADVASGRTVVLLHEETVNASAVHPYYTFLHDAGFQVLVLDPRGYGRSRGTPTLRAWTRDLDAVFTWLHGRSDVDRAKIALFGTSLGGLAAMWAARMHPECCALVFEHLPSPRDMLREAVDDDSAVGAYHVGVLEFGLPENLEPVDNAPFVHAPALFLAAERELDRDRRSLLRAFDAYAGEKDLWVIAGSTRAPHAMLTHDGEYQRRIAAFLAAAFAGEPFAIEASSRKARDASDGEAWYDIALNAEGGAPPAPWAVEVCAVLPDGTPHFARALLEGGSRHVRMKLPAPPAVVAAQRLFTFDTDPAGQVVLAPTPFARAGAAVAPLWPRIEEVRHGTATLDACRALAADLEAAAAGQPFHPRLAAELADVFALIGLALAKAEDQEARTAAPAWLQRAVDAVPEHPRLHFWPGPVPTYGFPQQEAVDRARRVLGQLTAQG